MKPGDGALLIQEQVQEDRAQAIRDAVHDAIVERRLAPGAKLVETEVGELFDVSRTVVRASLQMLAFEGLVRIERNRGAFVAYPTPDEARQIFDSRRVIEPEIAERAAGLMTEADIKLFNAHLKEEERLLVERGPNARRAAIKASGEAREAAQRALEAAGVEFIDENGGGAGVRLSKGRSGKIRKDG